MTSFFVFSFPLISKVSRSVVQHIIYNLKTKQAIVLRQKFELCKSSFFYCCHLHDVCWQSSLSWDSLYFSVFKQLLFKTMQSSPCKLYLHYQLVFSPLLIWSHYVKNLQMINIILVQIYLLRYKNTNTVS